MKEFPTFYSLASNLGLSAWQVVLFGKLLHGVQKAAPLDNSDNSRVTAEL